MLQQVRPPRPYRADARTPDGLFRPAPRGDLSKALSTRGKLQAVAPESPRPAEMLEDVQVTEVDGFRLTTDDATLHELLISHAYAGDRSMPDTVHSYSVGEAIRYLGGRVERSDIWACLRRLKATTVSYGAAGGRQYANVSLIEWWSEQTDDEDLIRYTLPAPLRDLLGRQPRYAYLELAALPSMSSKFSLRLYKRLVLEASKRKWVPDGDNVISMSPTPDELASWVGFPVDAEGKVRAGKLRERVLDKLEEDFADVRAFRLSVNPRHGPGRGAPLIAVDLEIALLPPSLHAVPMFFNPSDDIVRKGNKDIEKYRIDSRTVRRAAKTFRQLLAKEWADLWQIAIHEAVTRQPLTAGFETGKIRGERLLQAVESRGANYAAWALFSDESVSPDLTALRQSDFRAYLRSEKAADEARIERLGDEAPRGTKRSTPLDPVTSHQDSSSQAAAASTTAVTPLTFDDCGSVILTIDPEIGNMGVDDIGTYIMKVKWTGTRHVNIVLRFGSHAHETWKVGRYPMSEDDLDSLLARYRREFDGQEEYA